MGEAPKQSGVALPGSVVTVYYDDDKTDTETFLIATRQEGVSDGKLEVYSPNSPLGAALIDAKVGETRTYTVPNGNTVEGHAGQAPSPTTPDATRRAPSRYSPAHGADRRGPVSAAVGQRIRAARSGPVTT